MIINLKRTATVSGPSQIQSRRSQLNLCTSINPHSLRAPPSPSHGGRARRHHRPAGEGDSRQCVRLAVGTAEGDARFQIWRGNRRFRRGTSSLEGPLTLLSSPPPSSSLHPLVCSFPSFSLQSRSASPSFWTRGLTGAGRGGEGGVLWGRNLRAAASICVGGAL